MATYVWLVIIGLNLIVEAISLELIASFFAVGAVVGLIESVFGVNNFVQVLSFLVASGVLFIFRPKLYKSLVALKNKRLINQYLGKIGVVVKHIALNKIYLVKFNKRKVEATFNGENAPEVGETVKVSEIKNGIIYFKRNKPIKGEDDETKG